MGIKKYLYTVCNDHIKLLFLSTEYYAALHDNFDNRQFQARVTKTRVVKAIIVVLVTATVATVAIALPCPVWDKISVEKAYFPPFIVPYRDEIFGRTRLKRYIPAYLTAR